MNCVKLFFFWVMNLANSENERKWRNTDHAISFHVFNDSDNIHIHFLSVFSCLIYSVARL